MNQYDTEKIREALVRHSLPQPSSREREEGAVCVEDFKKADVCVVNTCTVTEEADKDALRLLRKITRRNPAAQLVVTGCLASRDPEALAREFPAARVVGNNAKDEIPALIGCSTVAPGFGLSSFHGHSRAFVKVQDGCNMHCTYCIVPEVRPQLSCRPYPEVEAEVRGLLEGGYREIVLCGVRLGRYLVWHEDKRIDLATLIEKLMELAGAPSKELRVPGAGLDGRTSLPDFRVRLSSLEITDLTDRMIRLLEDSGGRFCPSLHLPLQSGSDAVLKRMQRWYSTSFYRRRIEALRERMPDAGLFTDVMHGFPGETEGEFQETVAFLKEMRFSGLHVFRYSQRERTPASQYEGQIPDAEKQRRADVLHALDKEFRTAFAAAAVGSRRRVLIEQPGVGMTDHFLKVRLSRPLPRQMSSGTSPKGGGNGNSGELEYADISGVAGIDGVGRVVGEPLTAAPVLVY